MRKKLSARRISLTRETVLQLDPIALSQAAAATGATCASHCTACCPPTTTTK
jgi:hypothetical protein